MGEMPIVKSFSPDLDYVYLRVHSEKQALEKVLNIFKFYKDKFSLNSTNLQILVPMYKGTAGIENINNIIQSQFNPGSILLKKEKISFKKGDKVMQVKNNYQKEIFNGEQGIVLDYDNEKKILYVDFDNYIVDYHQDETDEIILSYAISIHKSQGSEYDFVVVVFLPSHSLLINREILYTAVTRAKNKIFMISDENTILKAVKNSNPSERKTMLPVRLKEIVKS
jgi:exodeoxyribonuclease V alpha subunit